MIEVTEVGRSETDHDAKDRKGLVATLASRSRTSVVGRASESPNATAPFTFGTDG